MLGRLVFCAWLVNVDLEVGLVDVMVNEIVLVDVAEAVPLEK